MSLRVTATGPADLDEVWRRYSTRGEWSSWAPQLTSVTPDGAKVRVGDRGTVGGPWPARVDYVIESRDEGARTWSWRVGIGRIHVRMQHGVKQTPEGTQAWLKIALPAPLVVGYAPLAYWALRRLVSE